MYGREQNKFIGSIRAMDAKNGKEESGGYIHKTEKKNG